MPRTTLHAVNAMLAKPLHTSSPCCSTTRPEFQHIAVAFNSPLPIMMSLWLLTKAHARVRLVVADVDQARTGDGV